MASFEEAYRAAKSRGSQSRPQPTPPPPAQPTEWDGLARKAEDEVIKVFLASASTSRARACGAKDPESGNRFWSISERHTDSLVTVLISGNGIWAAAYGKGYYYADGDLYRASVSVARQGKYGGGNELTGTAGGFRIEPSEAFICFQRVVAEFMVHNRIPLMPQFLGRSETFGEKLTRWFDL